MAAGCRYDEAGPWLGGSKCRGSLIRGTDELGKYLARRYGEKIPYQGYACRQNTADASQMSVHGTGRALDFFPQNKTDGDAIAALLAHNHARWGIQLVIWWRRDWQCDQGWTGYTGPNPHTDHLHIELTVPAAGTNTAATYAGKEDLSIVDRATKEYLDSKFKAIAERDAGLRAAVGRIRETQLQQGKTQKVQGTVLVKIAQAENVSKTELDGLEADLAEIDAELDEIAADIGGLHSDLNPDEPGVGG